MDCMIIIPARMGSTRLQGKPLKLINGVSLINHVYLRATMANIGPVVVATDHADIASMVESSVITGTAANGTERIAKAMQMFPTFAWSGVVINVQGDMPFVDPDIIVSLRDFMMVNPSCQVATVAKHRTGQRNGAVSVVMSSSGRALYFSRASIPSRGTDPDFDWYQHIGMYAYRVSALQFYAKCQPSRHEIAEDLEQMRFIDNDVPVHVMTTCLDPGQEINTPEDLEKANA
ncbi:MAG: hypothetical protein BWK76_23085 [Desulfobulbaceae bacterium A2]|nr:MAG: hypothetical protein BWK76_23085 [Desulfobulbaceae bacterium A2]